MKQNEPVDTEKQEEESILEKIIREGAGKILQAAIENEVAAYIALFSETKDENGKHLIVHNGFLPEHSILTGIGPITVKQPGVRDKREDKQIFTSAILPRYLRPYTISGQPYSCIVPERNIYRGFYRSLIRHSGRECKRSLCKYHRSPEAVMGTGV